jgi:hypothetical protein
MDSAMTLQQAKSIARHLGLTLRKVRSGDYRVNFRDGNETTAYYTDDLEDAINAAVEMRVSAMPEIKEVSEQMRGYTIRAARVGSDEWGYITVKGENGKLYVRAFDTLDEAQEFIDAFMPDGWRAEIDLVTAKIVGYDGVKH